LNKRITALTLAALSVPVMALSTAAPAAAADCAAAYNASGRAYGLRISPSYAKVPKGSVVTLSTRLFRGTVLCNGEKVGFYTHNKGVTKFDLTRTDTTDSQGLGIVYYKPIGDFRYFVNFNINAVTPGARSAGGLIQVS
jgi:hypothetical protein